MPVYVRLNISTTEVRGLPDGESYLDLDSHADTCVLGNNALIIESPLPDRTAIVSFADPSVGTVTKPILSGAFKYTSPYNGSSYILIVNQGIHPDNLDHSLLCPMQLRDNDVILNEQPKSMTDNPTEETHSLLAVTEEHDQFRIPFRLRGVTSTMYVSKPTAKEYEELPHVILTNRDTEWDPHNPDFGKQEDTFINIYGEFQPPGDKKHQYVIKSMERNQQINVAALNSLQGMVHSQSNSESILNSIDPTLNIATFSTMLNTNRQVSVTSTSNRKGLSSEQLARKWKISLKQAENTLRVTTQRGIRHIANPAISRRFKTNDRMLRYNRIPHTVFTDTLKSTVKSKRQNTHAQVYCTDFGWTRAYPMKTESEAHYMLSSLFKDVGVPNKMVMDNAKTQVLGKFRQKSREADCRVKSTEPHTPFSNAAESAIRELKKATGRRLTASGCPKRLWDDCMELESFIRSHTALDIWQLQGQVPQTFMTGQTADISQFYELEWYEWCFYHDSAIKFPNDKFRLGRWLGPAIDVGPAMTGKILKPNGNTRYVSTYRALTPEEYETDEVKAKMEAFNTEIHKVLGPAATAEDVKDEFEDSETPIYEAYQDDETKPYIVPDRDEYQSFDKYIGAEVMLPHQNQVTSGKVRQRKREADGTLKGTTHAKTMFDTRAYIIEFPDGAEAEYTANVIAENMYAQCNPDGEQFLIMESIRDHKKDGHAVDIADAYIYPNGRKKRKKTTKGWHMCIEWKDGTTSWETLASLKESYPVQVAEYALAAGISDEPAFKWWVPHVLNKRDRIIAKVKTRYHKQTHKFGFEVPKTVTDALRIDEEHGDDRWATAIKKEIDKVQVAFDILPRGDKPPIGFNRIGVHLIFDVKMENFQFKA